VEIYIAMGVPLGTRKRAIHAASGQIGRKCFGFMCRARLSADARQAHGTGVNTPTGSRDGVRPAAQEGCEYVFSEESSAYLDQQGECL
jgi:hypothetical protein